MAEKDPIMRAEFWFGGRKNKKLVEIKHRLSNQEQFVKDFLQFLDKKGYEYKTMWPEREPDFIDEKGRKFWVKEGLIQYNNNSHEIAEFFIRNETKTLRGKEPHVRTKKINSRRRQVSSEEYDLDKTYNNQVMNEIMNHMLLTDILGEEDGEQEG